MQLFNLFRDLHYEGLEYLATVAAESEADALAYYRRAEPATAAEVDKWDTLKAEPVRIV